MSIGALYLNLRKKYEHGLKTAYYRDAVRGRILRSSPVAGTTNRACEIHVLTSAADWVNMMWALKSFYWVTGRDYALCVHDDGSLTPELRSVMQRHFPEARVVARDEADRKVLPLLAGHPRCLEFRRTNQLSPKVFDFMAYLESDRMLLLDSDILFFSEPRELLRRIEDPAYRLNAFNADVSSAYTVEPRAVRERTGVELGERINSGLALVHRDSMRLDWIEEFLGLPGIIGHFWRIEQTLYALCASKYGVELLPGEYDVRLAEGIGHRPSRHYVGAIRHLMYSEGMCHLVRRGFLREVGH
ncbi:MAG TPA: hypothetical protein VGV38_01685 [Pyrinomonadaceae bacterium]|nr:hypothetical protein [Pyrinomonadaceae bacterium]